MSAVRSPWQPWTCDECGHVNRRGGSHCDECITPGFTKAESAAYHAEMTRRWREKKGLPPIDVEATWAAMGEARGEALVPAEEEEEEREQSSDDSSSDSEEASGDSDSDSDDECEAPSEQTDREEIRLGGKREESESSSDDSEDEQTTAHNADAAAPKETLPCDTQKEKKDEEESSDSSDSDSDSDDGASEDGEGQKEVATARELENEEKDAKDDLKTAREMEKMQKTKKQESSDSSDSDSDSDDGASESDGEVQKEVATARELENEEKDAKEDLKTAREMEDEEDVQTARDVSSDVMYDKLKRDELAALKKCKKIRKKCRASGTRFVDDEFPHTLSSLGTCRLHSDHKEEQMRMEVYENVVWLPPEEMETDCKAEWSVMWDPQPSDVKQGCLGDCWLICSMALVAERPELLDRLFITKQWNEEGVYALRLCVHGEWRVVIVDAYLPCHAEYKCPVFVWGARNQLWMCLIEKGLAKLWGDYSALYSNSEQIGMEILTGASIECITLPGDRAACEESEIDKIWAKLVTAKSAGYVMSTSIHCPTAESLAECEQRGLYSNHAYSLLAVSEEAGHRLVRIRNPWGAAEKVWNGEWSDEWEGWSYEMKSRLIPHTVHGAWWMSFEDYLQYFSVFTFARTLPGSEFERRSEADWYTLRESLNVGWTGERSVVRLEVDDVTKVSFAVHELDVMRSGKVGDAFASLHRVCADGQIGECVDSTTRIDHGYNRSDELFIDKGSYVLIAHSFRYMGEETETDTVNVVVHCSRRVAWSRVACPPQMVRDALFEMVWKKGNRSEQEGRASVRWITSGDFFGTIVAAENAYNDVYAHVVLNLANKDGSPVNMVATRQNSLATIDALPPHTRQILNVLSFENPKMQGSHLSLRYHMELLRSQTLSWKEGYGDITNSPEITGKQALLHQSWTIAHKK